MSQPPKSPPEKFAFAHDFFELNVAPAGPKTPVSAAALEQAKEEGYAAGRAAAQQQAALEIAELKNQILGLTQAFEEGQNTYADQLERAALTVMRQALHHVVGHAAANYPDQILEHFLHTLLPLLRTTEELTLRIHPAARQYHEKLGLPQASIGGRPMHIVPDGTLGPADCVVEWQRGGMEAKVAQILAELDETLSHAGADTTQPVPAAPEAPAPTFNPEGPPPPAPFAPAAAPAAAESSKADQLLGNDELIEALR